MRCIAFDLESAVTAPGRQAPPIVCGAMYHQETGLCEVWEAERLVPKLVAMLRDPLAAIVGHNVVFDLGLMAQHDPKLLPEIFAAFQKGRVYDTMYAEALITVAKSGDAKGSNSLASVVERRLGIKMTGKTEADAWRLRYSELKGIPIEQYPPAARDYVVDDAKYAIRLMHHQVAECNHRFGRSTLPLFKDLMYEGWVFWLMGAWGGHSDGWVVSELSTRVEAELAKTEAALRRTGLMRSDGSIDTYELKLAVVRDYGTYVPPATIPPPLGTPPEYVDFATMVSQAGADAKDPKQQAEQELESIYANTHLALTYDDMAKGAEKKYPQRLGGAERGLRELRLTLLALETPDKIPLTNFENGSHIEGKPACSVSTNKDVLAYGLNDDLSTLAERKVFTALKGKYLPPLRRGTRMPIHARWNPVLATYRSSCSNPNWQNQPRFAGPRECVIPSYPDWVFIASDYGTAELRSLGQVCIDLFGYSKLADTINAGMDPHLLVAAGLLGLTYAEVYARKKEALIKKLRNLAKALNFGLPGGLGARKFISFAKTSYGVIIAEYAPERFWPNGVVDLNASDAVRTKVGIAYFTEVLKPQWLETYPEIKLYFQHIGNLTRGEDFIRYTHPKTGFIRGQVWYTRACNHNFQHLTAVGAKRALCQVAFEAYCDPESPLFGFRIPYFIHDEIIIEGPQHRAAAAAKRLEEVMVECMNALTPDVKAETDAHIMRRWRKQAEQVVEDGVLTPYEDRTDLQIGLGKPYNEVLSSCQSVYDVFLNVGVEYARAKSIWEAHMASRFAASDSLVSA